MNNPLKKKYHIHEYIKNNTFAQHLFEFCAHKSASSSTSILSKKYLKTRGYKSKTFKKASKKER